MKVVRIISVLLLGIAPGAYLGGTASADPGFCGVRSSGPTAIPNMTIYTVRNRCGSNQNFKVYLPLFGRYANSAITQKPCGPVGPYGTAQYVASVGVADGNWVVQAC